MCEYMRKIEEDFYMLSEESKEKIKRIVCSELCGGICKNKFLEQMNIT